MDNNDLKNNDLKNIYLRYKNILSGCRTIYDSLYFAQYFIKINPECKNLINGMIHGKYYEKVFDFRSMSNTLNILNECGTRNEVDEYINNNIKDNFDYIQINALIRLGRNKRISNNISNNVLNNKIFKFDKNIDNNLNSLLNINK
jgi:hypothetical protein